VAFPVLSRSRVLKAVDDQPVWSVVCFFTSKSFRHQGLTQILLDAAVDFAQKHGAAIVEGYPISPKSEKDPVPFLYNGIESTFLAAGFVEVARRSAHHPLMRKYL
jgi:hypothetical protein